jgi:hypothetical protein
LSDASEQVSTRAERNALGRRLLAEHGKLWSAVPVEWNSEAQTAAGALTGPQLPGFLWQVWASLGVLVGRPRATFAHVQEPVNHGAVLKLLHAVRLPLWLALIAVLGAVQLTSGGDEAFVLRPAHELLDPRLCEILSLWLVLMVPIGVPLLYFTLGVATHVALTLTGGAPRSIAASMRATGYALAPVFILIGLVDIPLHLGALPGTAYLAMLAAIGLLCFHQIGQALTGTHAISWLRGYVVAVVPVVIVLAVQLARALLVLPDLPGWAPPPGHPFFVP